MSNQFADLYGIKRTLKSLKEYMEDVRSQGKPADFEVHISAKGYVTIRSPHWDRLKSMQESRKQIK